MCTLTCVSYIIVVVGQLRRKHESVHHCSRFSVCDSREYYITLKH